VLFYCLLLNECAFFFFMGVVQKWTTLATKAALNGCALFMGIVQRALRLQQCAALAGRQGCQCGRHEHAMPNERESSDAGFHGACYTL
jgi:hypothetical protein